MSGKLASLRLAAMLGAALMAPAAAHAAVIFNSLTMSTSTYATAKRGASVDTHSDTKSTTKSSLPAGPASVTSATSAMVAVSGVNRIQSNATSTVTAALWSPDAGSFDVTTVDSIVQALASTTAQPISGQARAGAFSIAYAFTVTGPKTFALDYALFDPNFVGATPLVAALTGPTGAFTSNLTRNGSGTVTSLLGTGSYILTLNSAFESQIGRSGQGIGATAGGSFDHFNFSIASVPEPSAWALLILGFGMTGCAMRRRRTATTRLAALAH